MNAPYQSLPITSGSPGAAAAIHAFADQSISHGSNTRIVLEAVAEDPGCALAHALAGARYLTRMTQTGREQAAAHVAMAQESAHGATPRERRTVAAVAAWSNGDNAEAIRLFRSIVDCWPDDLVAAKLCQLLELDAGDIAGMLRTSSMAIAADRPASHAFGLHAFALAQSGDHHLAKQYGRMAIELGRGRDPWAQHAVAHSLVALNRPLVANAFLYSCSPDWDRCSSAMQSHNWCHIALLELELGNLGGALALFDGRVWGVRKTDCQDQVNAIALLARLEMAGVVPEWRWQDIAAHVEAHCEDHVSVFLDLHYLYALARSGRDAAARRMAQALCRYGPASLAGSLAQGLLAYALGDRPAAAVAFAPFGGHFGQTGRGNHLFDLFEAIRSDSLSQDATPLTAPPRHHLHM